MNNVGVAARDSEPAAQFVCADNVDGSILRIQSMQCARDLRGLVRQSKWAHDRQAKRQNKEESNRQDGLR